jgi:hypothetical protein
VLQGWIIRVRDARYGRPLSPRRSLALVLRVRRGMGASGRVRRGPNSRAASERRRDQPCQPQGEWVALGAARSFFRWAGPYPKRTSSPQENPPTSSLRLAAFRPLAGSARVQSPWRGIVSHSGGVFEAFRACPRAWGKRPHWVAFWATGDGGSSPDANRRFPPFLAGGHQ